MTGALKRKTATDWEPSVGPLDHPHPEFITDAEHDDKARHDALGIDAATVDGRSESEFAFVDGSRPFTGPVQVPGGTFASPAIQFGGTVAGIRHEPTSDRLQFRTAASDVLFVGRNGHQIETRHPGSATFPVYTYVSDGDTGLFFPAADALELVAGGQRGVQMTPGAFRPYYSYAGTTPIDLGVSGAAWRDVWAQRTILAAGTKAAPAYAFDGSLGLGLYRYDANSVGLSGNGVVLGEGHNWLPYPGNGSVYLTPRSDLGEGRWRFRRYSAVSGYENEVLIVEASGRVDRPNWGPHAVTFQNGWINYGASYENASYHKDPAGFVHLQGLVKSGTIGSAVFTLPAGYAPAGHHIFSCMSSGGHTRVDIRANGNVEVTSSGTGSPSSWVSLAGITFYVGG